MKRKINNNDIKITTGIIITKAYSGFITTNPYYFKLPINFNKIPNIIKNDHIGKNFIISPQINLLYMPNEL